METYNVAESSILQATQASSSSAMAVLMLMTLFVLLAVILPHGSGHGHSVVYPVTYDASHVVASDIRLKTNVVATGTTGPMGLPLYQFSYKGHPQHRFEGVLAQDVARVKPDAVIKGKSGYLAVDYEKLGMKIRVLR